MSSKKDPKKYLIGILAFIVSTSGDAKADFVFGTPINLGPTVNTSAAENGPRISADGLSLYFVDYPDSRPGGHGGVDLWLTTRATTSDLWRTPVNLGPPVNSSVRDDRASISANGCTLFFASNRPGGSGDMDIWVTTRTSVSEPWGKPVNLGSTINSPEWDGAPSISADSLTLFFDSFRPGGIGGQDLLVTTRTTKDDDWGEPVNLGPIVNSGNNEWQPSISADGLALFFVRGFDLWVTTRVTTEDDWGPPMNLGPNVNASALNITPSISADGSTLYFCSSDRPGGLGGFDIWQAPIEPVVDFNGDGFVDADDMCIMVDYWSTDEPLCDIGPMPWGDGIVDVQDLIILAEHLFTYPGTLAHWTLDETEGDIAYDTAGSHNGILHGQPLWQPTDGQVAGALAFDGIDDYVRTPFVLNPDAGSFSVFAWIKGGAPGQVIISQTDGFKGNGKTWLGTRTPGGQLMSALAPASGGRSKAVPLESEAIITDSQWHHIGFVWDGSYRSLYLDAAEVAKDVVASLESANGGVYIGADKSLNPGSLWSGLIDDVRIYSVALTSEQIEGLLR